MSDAVLVDAAAAARAIAAGALAIDCRFDLSDPRRGEAAWAAGHLPGAVYADLDRDLADRPGAGRGRHPLPSAEAFAATLAHWGVAPDTLVIAYDDAGGAYAARLWWMLGLAGHRSVVVLDGGFAAWTRAGLPLAVDRPARAAPQRGLCWDRRGLALATDVLATIGDAASVLLDARAPARFRGDEEPIDPVAGHVPGALNRPWSENLAPDGCFKPAATLRTEYLALLAGRPAAAAIVMCGSGVTACHDLLAMHHAGLVGARVYAGSWSEWIADPARPVARGAD